MGTRLHAVTLVVPDYEAAIDFYVAALGFELVANEDLGGGKRWVLVRPPGGGAALLLAKASDAAQRAIIGGQTGGRVGFFLEADDFHAEHVRLLDAGVVFEETPRRESYGWVAVWRDPFGNRWDLIEFS
ncbi:MAG: VOC family protein [Pseudomonadota bacterium]